MRAGREWTTAERSSHTILYPSSIAFLAGTEHENLAIEISFLREDLLEQLLELGARLESVGMTTETFTKPTV